MNYIFKFISYLTNLRDVQRNICIEVLIHYIDAVSSYLLNDADPLSMTLKVMNESIQNTSEDIAKCVILHKTVLKDKLWDQKILYFIDGLYDCLNDEKILASQFWFVPHDITLTF